MLDKLKKIIIILMPWSLKRELLQSWMGYKIDKTARIGYSWFFPTMLEMGPHASVGHFNTAVHLDEIKIGAHSSIGRNNWITGFPSNSDSLHFKHQKDRRSVLYIGEHSAITKNHHLDCTHLLHIGKFVTVAGYHSQFLTHSINIMDNVQDSHPIHIGDYSFVGTNTVLLGGSTLPDYSVLGAKSLLNKSFNQTYMLYGGVPAKPVSEIPEEAGYFHRPEGFVV